MNGENNSDRPGRRSLEEIKATLLEMRAAYEPPVGSESTPAGRELKLDTDGEDLIFIGERGLGHRCSAMRCRSNEHVVFRVSFANLLITRKAKRLVRNFLKDL